MPHEEYKADPADTEGEVAMHVPNTCQFVMSKRKDFEDSDLKHWYIPVILKGAILFKKAVKKKTKRNPDQKNNQRKRRKKRN